MGSAFRETSGPLPPWALSGEALSACITCLKLQNYAPFRDHAGRLNHLKLDLSGKKGLGVSPLTVDSGVSATRDLALSQQQPLQVRALEALPARARLSQATGGVRTAAGTARTQL